MKKLNLILGASLFALGVSAQEVSPQILVGPDVLVEYQLVSMSANGKWACGNINDGDGRGFLWDIENNEIIQIAAIGTTAPVLDVANDGTMVGLFTTNEATANGAATEVGGYYKDGRWHYLEDCAILNGMSDNGQYFAGASYKNGICHAATWNINGEKTIWAEGIVGNAYDVTNDGTMACGWGNHHLKANRTPTLWAPDSIMLDYNNIGPNSLAWSFSPNGKKVLGDFVIYDVETKEKTKIDISQFVGFKLYRVTNEGVAVGEYMRGFGDMIRAAIVINGEVLDLQEYLVNKGVDLTGWTLIQCDGISEDGQTFAVNAYDKNSIPRPLIIRLNANLTNPAPTSFKVSHFEGTSVCRLTWKAPLANVEGVKGYQVWRNGEKLAKLSAGEYMYYDNELSNGTYEYAISAIYESTESEKSQTAEVKVSDFVYRAPRHLKAVASGVRDMRLSWNEPLANRPALKYGSSGDNVISFGGGDYSFEQAVRFDAVDWSVYGNQVTDVTFYPMSKQNSWTVNFYTAKDTALFASEKLDDSNLTFGVENTIKLKTPVTLPANEDIYVGIFVDVTGFGGYQTIGSIFGKYNKAGYTDLIRRKGEKSFMSLYEYAINDVKGAYEYPITFPIGMCMAHSNPSISGEVVSYKLYTNGEEVATTDLLNYRHKKLSNGDYRFSVSAVYADGKESEQIYIDKTMVENTAAYKAITELKYYTLDGKTLQLEWDEPVDDDETYISYAGESNAGGLAPSAGNGYSALYASVYDKDNLGDYIGYQITDIRFYPTSDAEFALVILENGKQIVWKDLERNTGYTKGLWNVVKLDEPITVKEGAEYTLIVDCYDVNPGEAPIGMDNQLAFTNESDLYSVDGGETFTSVSSMQTEDLYGNWLMGMIIRSPEVYPLPIEGYNVVVSRKTVNDTPLTETSYSYETTENATVQVRVNVLYEGLDEAVTGTMFFVDMATGIENLDNDIILIETTANQVTVLGDDVTDVKVYSLAGALVAHAEGAILDIAHLESGIYVLHAVVDGKDMQRKIQIK